VQMRAYRAMSRERRAEIVAEMSILIRSLACSGVRLRHPGYSDAETGQAAVSLLYGESAAPASTVRNCQMVAFDPAPFLQRLVNALVQAGVPFMLVGSSASGVHGVPRATRDLDLVIDPTTDALTRLLARLTAEGFYLDADTARTELRRRGQFNVVDTSAAWKADLIYRKNRPFSLAEFERRVPANLLGVEAFIATAEDTILAKLEWAKLGQSEQQLQDVRGIVETQEEGLDRRYIESWLDPLGLRELWERVLDD